MKSKEVTLVNFRVPEKGGERLPSVEINDGNGQKYLVADLDSEVFAPKEGILTVECLKTNRKSDPNISIAAYRDRKTGIFFGIPNGIDTDTKVLRWLRVTIRGTNVYDLSIPRQREMAIIVMNAPQTEGSRNQFGRPEFKVISQEARAIEALKQRKARLEAIKIVDAFTPEEMFDFAYAIGISPDGNSLNMLNDALSSYAEKNPAEFLKLYNDPNRNAVVVFKKAEKMGIIEYNPNSGYQYANQGNYFPLGMTEQQAIKTLMGNSPLLYGIDKSTKETIGSSKSENPINALDQYNEITALKKQVEELEARGPKLPKAPSLEEEEEGVESLGESDDSNDGASLEDLKVIAKNAGIKGYNFYTDPVKLREEIAKASTK